MVPKPTNFKRGTYQETSNAYEFVLTNIGGAPLAGPVQVRITLAAGVTAEEIGGNAPWTTDCNIVSGATQVECEVPTVSEGNAALEFRVAVSSSASEILETKSEVSGGGAPTVTEVFVNRVSPEKASFGISKFEAGPSGPAGEDSTVAGGHPSLFHTVLTEPMESIVNVFEQPPAFGGRGPIKNGKDLIVDLPLGLVGNPTATPKCPIQVFLAQQIESANCPLGSQVGTFAISGAAGVFQEGKGTVGERNPIYNLTPEPGYPAEFGLYDRGLSHGVLAPALLVHTSEGYVVRVVASEMITGVFGPYYLQTNFFGNPHAAAGLPGTGKALLTNPADCSGHALTTALHLDVWGDPAPVPMKADGSRNFGSVDLSDPRWYAARSESQPVTGCEALQFDPRFKLRPTESAADSPSGLDVTLAVPQNEDPEGLATPPLRDATVALPPGLVVNPSSASGLTSCSEAEIQPDSTNPGSCPLASKIGTATLRTPLLDHQLEGALYLGTPDCGPCTSADAENGKLLRLFIEIDDPSTGIVVKLPGTVSANPQSGQLTARFRENPQLPFEELELQIKSGARAPLTTPALCGEYTTTTDLMPWSAPQSGPDATPQSRFDINSGANGSRCASSEAGMPNTPMFQAGTAVPLAATYSPFVLRATRENGSQRISAIDATLPAGLVGKLAGIPYCSDAAITAASNRSGRAEQASPSCPSASEVGVVNVGAGSGTPFFVQGHAYLAGPYKGAPLSLEIITPAVAGPFDLGTVAVRTALYVEPYSAQIHAVSDPIPSILAGVPLDVRSIELNMNRPQFTLNPTSCDPMKVLASTTSTLGMTASLTSRFQVGGCKGLVFKPSLKLSLKGPTKRAGHPALKAVVTYPTGGSYANIARAQVGLPHSEFLDQGNLDKVCKQAELNSGTCPKSSVYGKAKAWSPLLDKPLEGPVYLGVGFGYKLPALVAELNGQVRILLKGKVDTTKHHGIRNTFEAVPDAPVSRFVLEMKGGKKYGLLNNSENLCKKPQKASALFTAQNGATLHLQPKIIINCKSGKGHKGKSGRR